MLSVDGDAAGSGREIDPADGIGGNLAVLDEGAEYVALSNLVLFARENHQGLVEGSEKGQ